MPRKSASSGCAEYRSVLAPDVRAWRRFDLKLSGAGMPVSLNEEEVTRKLYSTSIQSLVESAKGCRIFGVKAEQRAAIQWTSANSELRERRDRWMTTNIRVVRGVHYVNLDAPNVAHDAAFWSWIMRGGSVGELVPVLITTSRLNRRELFGNAQYVGLVRGLNDFVPRSAVDYAKRQTSTGKHIAAVFNRVGAPISLSIVSSGRQAERLFADAFQYARYLDDMIVDLCRLYIQPLEQSGWEYFVDLQPKSSTAPLMAELRRAARSVNSPTQLWTALSAAELIAAISGRPPQSFDRHDERLNREVADWVAKRSKEPLDQAAVLEARAVVRAVVADVGAWQRRLWRSREARAEWSASLHDLDNRLREAEKALSRMRLPLPGPPPRKRRGKHASS